MCCRGHQEIGRKIGGADGTCRGGDTGIAKQRNQKGSRPNYAVYMYQYATMNSTFMDAYQAPIIKTSNKYRDYQWN